MEEDFLEQISEREDRYRLIFPAGCILLVAVILVFQLVKKK